MSEEYDEIDIVIDPDGRVSAVHSDPAQALLAELGRVAVPRASDVEYDSGLGGWTVTFREWTGIASPPGTFPTRSEALAAELALLRGRMFEDTGPITLNRPGHHERPGTDRGEPGGQVLPADHLRDPRAVVDAPGVGA
jgi:hypothetical protein